MKYFQSDMEVMLGDRVTYSNCPGQVIGVPGSDADEAASKEIEDYLDAHDSVSILVIVENGALVNFGEDVSDTEDLNFVRRDVVAPLLIEYLNLPYSRRAPFNTAIAPESLPWPFNTAEAQNASQLWSIPEFKP